MDWDTVYDFQKSFRSRKAISAASLLRQLGLLPNLLQYLYTNKYQPSRKDGSIGLEFRQALETLMNSPEQQAALADDSSLTEKINEVLLSEDNKERLTYARILDVVVTDEDSKSVLILCAGHYDEAKVHQILGELTADLQLHINGFEIAYFL